MVIPPLALEVPAQSQRSREQGNESHEGLMIDSLISIATGLDGSLEEDSLPNTAFDYPRSIDNVSAGLRAKQDTLAPKALTNLPRPY